MAEYRLDELARVSGVSARNIRAYRERGLLDPPRRVGRSAYYDDYHLSQLKTINQLLRKGYNSAHIAEFFASMRQGADLADILGIQRAVLGPSSEELDDAPEALQPAGAVQRLDIDPNCDEARKLLAYGLAETVDGAVVLADRVMGDIVARADDHMPYVRAIVRIFEVTRGTIEELAAEVVTALDELYASRFGQDYIPTSKDIAEASQVIQDHRALGTKVVIDRFDEALQAQLVTAVSEYTLGILERGQWAPNPP